MESSTQRTTGPAAALATAAAGLMNGSCPLPDVGAAGQPDAGHFRQLAEAGYKSVLDLRDPSEPRGFDEAVVAREAGLRYENIPVSPSALGDAEFDRFRAFLKDPANRPTLVHCGSANRVGALLIPYLMLDEGRTEREALDLAQRAGLRSQELASLAVRYARTHAAPNR